MKKSTSFLVVAGLLALAASASPAAKPNILVILADDLGYGELSCQGYTQEIPTPNIDSIARNGVRFTSGYVSGPYCSPTRAIPDGTVPATVRSRVQPRPRTNNAGHRRPFAEGKDHRRSFQGDRLCDRLVWQI